MAEFQTVHADDPLLLNPLKVQYDMEADSSDSGEERVITEAFSEMHREEKPSLSLPPTRSVPSASDASTRVQKPSKKVGPKQDPIVQPALMPLAKVALEEPAPSLPIPKSLLPAPAPPPKRGEWWLTRTNRISNGCKCGVTIKNYEFRLIYCVYKPELNRRAPSYARMHGKIGWAYHHLNYKCLPAPSAIAQVEEVTSRESLCVEVSPLPLSHDESSEQLRSHTNAAICDALRQLRLAGHNVDLGAYAS